MIQDLFTIQKSSLFNELLPICPICNFSILSIRGSYVNSSKLLNIIFRCPHCNPYTNRTIDIQTFFSYLKPYQANSDIIQSPNCKIHLNEQLKYFCASCSQLICSKCKDFIHNTHLIESDSQYNDKVQKSHLTKAQFDFNYAQILHDNNRYYNSLIDEVTKTITSLTKLKKALESAYQTNISINSQLVNLAHLVYSNYSLMTSKGLSNMTLIDNVANVINKMEGYNSPAKELPIGIRLNQLIEYLNNKYVLEPYAYKLIKKIDMLISCCLIQMANGTLVSGDTFGTITLWSFDTNCVVTSYRIHDNSIIFLIEIEKLNAICSIASWCHDVKIFKLDTAQVITQLTLHSRPVCSMIKLNNEETFASGSGDKTVVIWSIRTGRCLKQLKYDLMVTALMQMKDNKLCLGADSGLIFLLDSESMIIIKTLYGHKINVTKMIQMNDKTIASMAIEIKIWDIDTNQCLKTIAIDYNISTSLCKLKNGDLLIGWDRGIFRRYETERYEMISSVDLQISEGIKFIVELNNDDVFAYNKSYCIYIMKG